MKTIVLVLVVTAAASFKDSSAQDKPIISNFPSFPKFPSTDNISSEVPKSGSPETRPVGSLVKPIPIEIPGEVPPLVKPIPIEIPGEVPPLVKPIPIEIPGEVPPLVKPIPIEIPGDVPPLVKPIPIEIPGEVPQVVPIEPIPNEIPAGDVEVPAKPVEVAVVEVPIEIPEGHPIRPQVRPVPGHFPNQDGIKTPKDHVRPAKFPHIDDEQRKEIEKLLKVLKHVQRPETRPITPSDAQPNHPIIPIPRKPINRPPTSIAGDINDPALPEIIGGNPKPEIHILPVDKVQEIQDYIYNFGDVDPENNQDTNKDPIKITNIFIDAQEVAFNVL